MRPDGQHKSSAGDKDLSNTATPLRRHPTPEVIHCLIHLEDADQGISVALVAQLWLLCTPSTHWPPCQAPETDLESMGQPMERGCRNPKAQEQSALQDLVLCFYAIIQMAADITSFFCRTDIDQVWFYFTVYQTCLGQHLIPDRNRHWENLFSKSVDAMW